MLVKSQISGCPPFYMITVVFDWSSIWYYNLVVNTFDDDWWIIPHIHRLIYSILALSRIGLEAFSQTFILLRYLKIYCKILLAVTFSIYVTARRKKNWQKLYTASVASFHHVIALWTFKTLYISYLSQYLYGFPISILLTVSLIY